MGTVTCFPGKVQGIGDIPPSKSAAHRAMIAAALAGGGRVEGLSWSDDIAATMEGSAPLGVNWITEGRDRVAQPAPLQPHPTVNCRESGSTLRFLLPLFAAKGINATLIGQGRLPERPLGVYAECLPAHGVTLSDSHLPLTLSGRLQAGEYHLPGNISSQFLTGLLFALPLCDGDSDLRLTTPLESAGYVDMTLSTLKQAGIVIEPETFGWHIPGNQTYRPVTHRVEKDWSQAAFFLAAGAIAGDITISGLDVDSPQGDKDIVDILRRFGADITIKGDTVTCRKAPLHGITIDATQIPDLVPILSVVAAYAKGDTHIVGAARLRIKESDRLSAMANALTAIGGKVTEQPDGLIVHGGDPLAGGIAEGCRDHRIVMSMAVAALGCEQEVTVTDGESVGKSWPRFFEDFKAIGGNTTWVP